MANLYVISPKKVKFAWLRPFGAIPSSFSQKFLLAQYKKTNLKNGDIQSPPFHLNKKEWAMCFLIWTPVTHIYDYLYYSHVADSCKHLGLLHHPLCCATLTAVDRSHYCQSLLFSLVTFCKKNVGLWHLYAVSVLPNPTPISEPTDFHYTWYEYFVIGIHTKL